MLGGAAVAASTGASTGGGAAPEEEKKEEVKEESEESDDDMGFGLFDWSDFVLSCRSSLWPTNKKFLQDQKEAGDEMIYKKIIEVQQL